MTPGWLTRAGFTAVVVAVGVFRLFELRLSRRHQKALAAHDVRPLGEPVFPAMVALHTGILIGAVLETWLWRRPFIPALALGMAGVLVAANALRLWVIRSLGPHWNVRVVPSMRLGVVNSGPYRFVRHPNYVAVFVELVALPLLHTAFVTASVGAVLHVLVLRARVRTEETVLFADPAYQSHFAHKPRFLPRLGSKAPSRLSG